MIEWCFRQILSDKQDPELLKFVVSSFSHFPSTVALEISICDRRAKPHVYCYLPDDNSRWLHFPYISIFYRTIVSRCDCQFRYQFSDLLLDRILTGPMNEDTGLVSFQLVPKNHFLFWRWRNLLISNQNDERI